MNSVIFDYDNEDIEAGVCYRIPRRIYHNKKLMEKVQPLIDEINRIIAFNRIDEKNK